MKISYKSLVLGIFFQVNAALTQNDIILKRYNNNYVIRINNYINTCKRVSSMSIIKFQLERAA